MLVILKTPEFRHLFTDYRALLPYSILGICAGVAAAGVILAFDVLIASLTGLWLEPGKGYESLPQWQRFALPVVGAMVLGLAFHYIPSVHREVGIVHVLSRMHSHYGRLPIRNLVTQILAGAFALATGQSGGREGPGVHLGAAINSDLGRRLDLPDNSQRILIACGTAGAISFAFNTPLAGVIFAMEVIVAEYTVVGFTPVILAAVSASVIGVIAGVGEPVFSIPAVAPTSLWELPFVMLLGALSGIAVVSFLLLLKLCLKLGHWPIALRFTIAGLVVGSLGIAIPQVLGMGYDTLNGAVAGQFAPVFLLLIMAAKIIATATAVGMGMPIGLIGPNLLIGACLGAGLGAFGAALVPELSSDPALYALIGMGACMAAVLNAPLAALLAVVELSQNVSIVFPALLAVVTATITRSVFRQQSAHQTILRHLKREISSDPASQMMQGTAVQSAMTRDFAEVPEHISAEQREDYRDQLYSWIVVERDGQTLFVLDGDDFARLLESTAAEETMNLAEIELRRWSVGTIRSGATLQEALDTLNSKAVESLLVKDFSIREGRAVRGILNRDMIDRFYLNKL